jgi:molecular chaperone HscB
MSLHAKDVLIWGRKNKKGIAQSLSTLVNEAYQNLSKPLSRAEYILKRNGVEISETEQLDDLEFISEVMEAREELENSEGGVPERIIQLANDNDRAYPILFSFDQN